MRPLYAAVKPFSFYLSFLFLLFPAAVAAEDATAAAWYEGGTANTFSK